MSAKRLLRPASLALMLACLLAAAAPLHGQVVQQRVVSNGAIETEPYRYVGLLDITNSGGEWVGSASLVHPRVVATAAHVVFDESTLSWSPVIKFQPRRHQSQSSFPTATYTLSGAIIHTSYAAAVAVPVNIVWPFNVDFAAAYRIGSDISADYGAYAVEAEGDIPEIRGEAGKLILGYPQDSASMSPFNIGKMHEVPIGNYTFYSALESEEDYPTLLAGRQRVIYEVEDVEVYGGTSGGPLFLQDSVDGRWVQTAVVSAGSGEGAEYTFSWVRGIDEDADAMIQAAAKIAGGISTTGAETDIVDQTLDWASTIDWPQRDNVQIWQVYRNGGPGWELVAELDAPPGSDVSSFTDTSVEWGRSYAYRVRGITRDGFEGPLSKIVRSAIRGPATDIGQAAGAPRLTWKTGGDFSWYADGTGLRSGKIPSLSSSWVETTVLGPGNLSFSWSSNCEPSEDAGGNDVHGNGAGAAKLYDHIEFLVDGVSRRKITGVYSEQQLSFGVGAGNHTFRWVYRKDDYLAAGEDAARISSVKFTSTNPQLRIAGAMAAGEGWHFARWFGYYYPTPDYSWIYSLDYVENGGGWIYLGGTQDGLWLYFPTPGLAWCYTSPEIYPTLWCPTRGHWIYKFRNTPWFYDLENGEWLKGN